MKDDDENTDDVDESTALNEEVMMISDNAVRGDPDVNNAPVFESASMMREVMENEDGNVGDPVDGDRR